MKKDINWALACEFDTQSDFGQPGRPHCYITRNGERVAHVWLDYVLFDFGHYLNRGELYIVLDFLNKNRNELIEIFNQEYTQS